MIGTKKATERGGNAANGAGKGAENWVNKKLRVQCTATNLNLNNCRARTGAYKKVFVFFVFLIVFVFEE